MMTSTQLHDTTGSKDDSVMHLQVVVAAPAGVVMAGVVMAGFVMGRALR